MFIIIFDRFDEVIINEAKLVSIKNKALSSKHFQLKVRKKY